MIIRVMSMLDWTDCADWARDPATRPRCTTGGGLHQPAGEPVDHPGQQAGDQDDRHPQQGVGERGLPFTRLRHRHQHGTEADGDHDQRLRQQERDEQPQRCS